MRIGASSRAVNGKPASGRREPAFRPRGYLGAVIPGMLVLPVRFPHPVVLDLTRIQPELFIGNCPRSAVDVERLRRGPGITAVLNLQTDVDFTDQGIDWTALHERYLVSDLVVVRWPIEDFNPGDLRKKMIGAVQRLEALLSAGHRVYLHCTAGVGRAPAVAVAYLSWNRGWVLEEAHSYVVGQRACAPCVDAIRLATLDRDASIENGAS